MEMKIAAAADAGISYFYFDWYYFQNQTFLGAALDNAFMKASNNHLLKVRRESFSSLLFPPTFLLTSLLSTGAIHLGKIIFLQSCTWHQTCL